MYQSVLMKKKMLVLPEVAKNKCALKFHILQILIFSGTEKKLCPVQWTKINLFKWILKAQWLNRFQENEQKHFKQVRHLHNQER